MLDQPAFAPAIRDAASAPRGWNAQLTLRFAQHHGGTALVHREHQGPLVVQKSLHPEGPQVCQAVIVHPPGGIAGGDLLHLDVGVGSNAHAQLITAGAAKWYRSKGPEARQSIEANVADGGVLEWLPHESIVFDGALARMNTRLSLEGSATAILWDVMCLGRTAAGERFDHGAISQRVEVVRDNALVWTEQSVLPGSGAVMHAPVGLHGHCVIGTLLVAAPCIEDAWLAGARSVGSVIALDDHAVTRVPGVLIARCRSTSTAHVHAWFHALWKNLRPQVMQRAAVSPRLWMT